MATPIFEPAFSRSAQGSKMAVEKQFPGCSIVPKGNGNGNWIVSKPADILIDGISYRDEILNYYHREKLTEELFRLFLNDYYSGRISLSES